MNIEKHYDDIFFNYKILTYPETIIKLIKNEPTSPIVTKDVFGVLTIICTRIHVHWVIMK